VPLTFWDEKKVCLSEQLFAVSLFLFFASVFSPLFFLFFFSFFLVSEDEDSLVQAGPMASPRAPLTGTETGTTLKMKVGGISSLGRAKDLETVKSSL
jgi:hypothetical protein